MLLKSTPKPACVVNVPGVVAAVGPNHSKLSVSGVEPEPNICIAKKPLAAPPEIDTCPPDKGPILLVLIDGALPENVTSPVTVPPVNGKNGPLPIGTPFSEMLVKLPVPGVVAPMVAPFRTPLLASALDCQAAVHCCGVQTVHPRPVWVLQVSDIPGAGTLCACAEPMNAMARSNE